MVCRDHQAITGTERSEQRGQPSIEVLESRSVPERVVAMSIHTVELDEVGQNQLSPALSYRSAGALDALDVVDSLLPIPAKMSRILPIP